MSGSGNERFPYPGLPVDPFPSRDYGAPRDTNSPHLSKPLQSEVPGIWDNPPVHITPYESLQQNKPALSQKISQNHNIRSDHDERQVTPNQQEQTSREWVAFTAYQPVDIVTRTVEVPVTRVVDVLVPKPIIKEKIVEVPKRIPKIKEKIVEVPQVEYVERVVEVPEVIYNTKYVPKVEVLENVVEKPVYKEKWIDKFVEVTVVEEVIRYRTVFEPEEVIKYIPRGHSEEEWRGAPVYTMPPANTPELPPKWSGTPQPSPRHPLLQNISRPVSMHDNY